MSKYIQIVKIVKTYLSSNWQPIYKCFFILLFKRYSVPIRCHVWVLLGTLKPTWEGPLLRYYISVEMPSVTVEALMSATEVLHQDFGKHKPDFLTVPFVYRADRPQLNRKGLVCVWSINQKFVKHKVAPKGFTQSSQLHLWLTEWPRFITA